MTHLFSLHSLVIDLFSVTSACFRVSIPKNCMAAATSVLPLELSSSSFSTPFALRALGGGSHYFLESLYTPGR
jgi:hypothetical protein